MLLINQVSITLLGAQVGITSAVTLLIIGSLAGTIGNCLIL